MQVEGALAIEAGAVPALTMDAAHSVRDVFANVGTAPTEAPVQLQLTVNGQPYCALTIPPGSAVSNSVDGFALGPIPAQAQIGLDIVSVPQTSTSVPGADLTVTIRL